MKTGNEATVLARHISSFLNEYVPTQKTASANTLKAYQDTIGLYLQFLKKRGSDAGIWTLPVSKNAELRNGLDGCRQTGITSRKHEITGWHRCALS